MVLKILLKSSSGIPIPLSIILIYASEYTKPTYILIFPPSFVYLILFVKIFLSRQNHK